MTLFDDPVVSRKVGGLEVEELCGKALGMIGDVVANPQRTPTMKQRAQVPPPEEVPVGHPPTEAELRVAIETRRVLLASCRNTYSRDKAELALDVTISPNGEVSNVDVAGEGQASTFASCVSRVVRQSRFAAFRGSEAHLRATVTFDTPLEDPKR